MFDLVACGTHTGGAGNVHDQFAIDAADAIDLPPRIRHASAVGFLTLKCGAYRDRGAKAPIGSKDLSDIVTLAATRPGLVTEVASAPPEIRTFIRDVIASIRESPAERAAVGTHVENGQPLVVTVIDDVLETLAALAQSA